MTAERRAQFQGAFKVAASMTVNHRLALPPGSRRIAMERSDRKLWVRLAVLAALCLVQTGCTVGPDYVRPTAVVADDWVESADGERVEPEKAPPTEWWKVFGDPVLDGLVERAYAQNLPLRVAGVRVLQAMAARGIAVGGLFPQVQELSGDYTRAKASGNGPPVPSYSSTWRMGLDAAWELDFWGKFRRSIESSDAELDASLANYDAVVVSLVAEVALTYVEIRTLQLRIKIAEENVEQQERSLELAVDRFEAGSTSKLDPTQVRSLLAETRAAIPSLGLQLKQAAYRLSFLLGTTPGDILSELGNPLKIPAAPSSVAVGIPADLLRRRPDIRLAERQAAAQSARIGVAEAEMYPAFFLSGGIGFGASDPSDLLTGQSWTGSITPGFRWPIFNYGRLTNNVRVQDAEFQAAIINYRNAVLAAAGEVESGLAGFLGSQDREAHLREAVKQSQLALDLSQLQYAEGTADFQRVLDALTGLRAVQDAMVSARGDVAASLITTHKAMGGGWELRQGMDIVPEETRAEMAERTNWDDLLEPAAVEGTDYLVPRHDPNREAVEYAKPE
jgi:NodT family efflux transporter outer membrane factor (OMF) lipoprotein